MHPESGEALDVNSNRYDVTEWRKNLLLQGSSGSAKTQIVGPDGFVTEVNESGQMHVVQRGCICPENSSSTPLEGDASFTGEAVDTLDYAIIVISVWADKVSADDGLLIEFSTDGTNWDHRDEYTIPALVGKTFSCQTSARYFRVKYTNGSEAQGAFRLQTLCKKTYTKPSSHRIQDHIINNDDAELVKSVLSAEDPNEMFVNIGATKSGNLKTTNAENGLAIAAGDVTDKTFVHKFGQAPEFATNNGEVTIWDGADKSGIDEMTYTWSTSVAIDSISSSNDNDTQEVQIQGLDADLNLVIQTATLQGQTRVALSTPLIRVFRAKNSDTVDFAGYIYVYENTTLSAGVPVDTSKVRLVIQGANNQTLMALYTIPIDKTGYMRDWYASTAGASKDSEYIIRLWAREYDATAEEWKVWQLKHITSISDAATSYIQHKYEEPQKFTGGVDVMITVESTAVGASDASIAAGFDIVLIDN